MAGCSAPGKIFLIGGYSVLQKGNVGYVTAIDKRVHAVAEELPKGEVEFSLPDLELHEKGRFDEAVALSGQIDEKKADKLSFAKAALEASLSYAKAKGRQVKGVKLTTRNDPGFTFKGGALKAGFGSSAAATTAMVAAVMRLHGFDLRKDREVIHRVAQYAHAQAQGKVGSGFDIAAAVYGCIRYFRYSPEAATGKIPEVIDRQWDYRIDSVSFPPQWKMEVGFSGKSASTREMVKKVNEFKAGKPEAYAQLISDMNKENENAVKALEEIGRLAEKDRAGYEKQLERIEKGEEPVGPFAAFKKSFVEGRVLLKRLGEESGAPIETDEFTRLIELAEENGAFVAKLPGAGGGDSFAAVCLSKKACESVRKAWKREGMLSVEINLSREGMLEE